MGFADEDEEIKHLKNEILWAGRCMDRGYELEWCCEYIVKCFSQLKEIESDMKIDMLKNGIK